MKKRLYTRAKQRISSKHVFLNRADFKKKKKNGSSRPSFSLVAPLPPFYFHHHAGRCERGRHHSHHPRQLHPSSNSVEDLNVLVQAVVRQHALGEHDVVQLPQHVLLEVALHHAGEGRPVL